MHWYDRRKQLEKSYIDGEENKGNVTVIVLLEENERIHQWVQSKPGCRSHNQSTNRTREWKNYYYHFCFSIYAAKQFTSNLAWITYNSIFPRKVLSLKYWLSIQWKKQGELLQGNGFMKVRCGRSPFSFIPFLQRARTFLNLSPSLPQYSYK